MVLRFSILVVLLVCMDRLDTIATLLAKAS